MPTPLPILNKIKLLLKLTESPNPHEANSAQQLANKLIEKHGVNEEELESLKDPVDLYGEDEKLYTSIGIVGWRQQLALVIGTHFECQIVQVESVPTEGDHVFDYFVYGDAQDVKYVQMAFLAFSHKVEYLIDTQCLGRGPIYIASYGEGVTDAIKQNIVLYGINLPEVNKEIKKNEAAVVQVSEGIIKPKDKPEPTEKRADVSAQSRIGDIMAYFLGVEDGKDLFLQDMLESKL